eukprot:SAG22_NODE_1267_length_4952_cov_3.730476_3_plen_115_part_00
MPGAVGGIPPVVALVSSDSEQVAGTAAYALANLCCNDAAARQAAGQASAVPAVVSELLVSLQPGLRVRRARRTSMSCPVMLSSVLAAVSAFVRPGQTATSDPTPVCLPRYNKCI